MLQHYYTVNAYGFEEQIIQKSRFIGYVKRVETEAEAQIFIQEIKKKHYDATHNCSAYMIGEHDNIQKANDDGEPSGTAGVPILEVIKKQQLKDTAIVVTRYFGGVKLGAGGLIRAYGSTASKAIKATGIVSRKLMQGISIVVAYPLLGKIENELRNSDHMLDSINYLEQVTFNVFVQLDQVDPFIKWIIELTGNQAEISKTTAQYAEQEISS
ncbi:YigZ family protein [Virgibacillus sp. W0430]|uniref:YigZ family protein n=1 Tax=Virgibacillus sp. W0430 TaxID=3391580 RepID=UPI003F456E39